MSAPVPAGHDQQPSRVPTPPPPGPGVNPPFPAPPTEGSSIRLWLGLGVAGLAALLCCGGGFTAMVALVITGTEAVNEQAQRAVTDHFEALRARRFADAYEAMCPEARQRETEREFADRMSAQPRIVSYDVGDAQLTATITVPVDVRYADGDRERYRVELAQDTSTGELEVCWVDR